jgi:hypothetical protein
MGPLCRHTPRTLNTRRPNKTSSLRWTLKTLTFYGGSARFWPCNFFPATEKTFWIADLPSELDRLSTDMGGLLFASMKKKLHAFKRENDEKWRNLALWGATAPWGLHRSEPKVLFRHPHPSPRLLLMPCHQRILILRGANRENISRFLGMGKLEVGGMSLRDNEILVWIHDEPNRVRGSP